MDKCLNGSRRMKNRNNIDKLRHLKIISGLSGSGKSIALSALEDLGYYCVDNLPIVLLGQFARNVLRTDSSIWRAAVSIDSRNKTFLNLLVDSVKDLKELNISYEFMFLDAEQSVLVKRYSETRRKHPLMDDSVPLLESINLERDLLAPLSERATKHIDTTHMTPHELRHLIQEDAARLGNVGEQILLFKSFAYKRGAPLDADFVFDVRCLPNPYWVESLKHYSGLDLQIQEYFRSKPAVGKMINQIDEFISSWIESFHIAGRTYLIIAVGCTGGRHRSVYVVEKLVNQFSAKNVKVQKRHSGLV